MNIILWRNRSSLKLSIELPKIFWQLRAREKCIIIFILTQVIRRKLSLFGFTCQYNGEVGDELHIEVDNTEKDEGVLTTFISYSYNSNNLGRSSWDSSSGSGSSSSGYSGSSSDEGTVL